jgi:dipeptidyl aminopeptidase/acylaminoacyl peptidase
MKNSFLFFILLLFLSYCTTPETPKGEDDEIQQYTIEQFMDNISISGGSFSPDNAKILVSSNETGISNAYAVDVSSGERTALTSSEGSPIYALSYFPEDESFLYTQDDNGNEIYHIFIKNAEGQSTELTTDPEARAEYYGWTQDRQSFLYGYNERDPRFMDVFEYDIAGMKAEMIYKNEEGFIFAGVSPDEKYIALLKPITSNTNKLFVLNRTDNSLDELSTTEASYSPTDFSKDGRFLYFTTDEGSEFSYLMRYDLESGVKEEVLKKDWDIVYQFFSPSGKYQVVGINADGKTEIEVTDQASGNLVAFPDFGQGSVTSVGFSEDERMMSFYVGSSTSPQNLFVYNLQDKTHKKLTETLNPDINPDDLVTAEVVRYPSFDDLDIPAIYYKPHQASAANKVPALVWVHGGPGGQSRQGYNPTIQYLVNHGYAVLAVNNRGSSGYGKTFFTMDDQKHGEEDLMDCVEGKNWLASREYIDAEKIGILGGSYGGFMVMAALVHQPEAFEVGVNIFGVTNWIRTLKSIPPWWTAAKDALYDEMGDPYTEDSVRLYRISPLFHAERIVKPVMVLQGAQDPRVLQVESDEIVEAARTNDIPVEYVLFEDEGHGFRKKENQIEAYGKILEFLDKFLKKKEEIKG